LFSVKQKIEKGPDERRAASSFEQNDREVPIERNASQPDDSEPA
jgi:hypothetical protein